MTFPWPTKRWIAAQIERTVDRKVAEACEEHFNGEDARLAASRLRDDLDTLVLQGKRLEDRGLKLDALSKELNSYAHSNVHDLRNVLQELRGLFEQEQQHIDRLEQMMAEIKELLMSFAFGRKPNAMGAGKAFEDDE